VATSSQKGSVGLELNTLVPVDVAAVVVVVMVMSLPYGREVAEPCSTGIDRRDLKAEGGTRSP